MEHHVASATPPRPPPPAASPSRGSSKAEAAEDEYIMNAPADLVCPLTLAPFIDPVLTSAGHVYERAAIQAHMERSSTDPLTRQPLLNKSLTPVYVLRSRALEYRESVAKVCIERVCSGAVAEPMRYLRRAVELIADTGSHVQGLSDDTVRYVLDHPSNAYDRIALQMFAQGLYQSGYRDRAAAIYSSLLLEHADRMQQAELLRRCLSCWTEDVSSASGDEYVHQKLVSLFEGRAGGASGLGWDQLVDLAQHAQLGEQFVLRLCEQLLFRTIPASASAACNGSGSGEELFTSSGSSGMQEKRLLLKYVHVLTDSLQRRQSETERRLHELERWRRQRFGGGGRSSSSLHEEASSGSGHGGRGTARRLPALLRHPALLASCMFVMAALPLDHPAARVLRALPFLALLPPSDKQ